MTGEVELFCRCVFLHLVRAGADVADALDEMKQLDRFRNVFFIADTCHVRHVPSSFSVCEYLILQPCAKTHLMIYYLGLC